ncbi:winged helix-turn-helix transcriptional regulator [Glutamicibacter arilaitensis]|uniref:Transcriptional regulator n=3 Tax=Glutamicibacter arilaitensis TaxID=256701 RepID=A0A2N7RYL6_9MICC|nr:MULTISPECIES: helix-turn-helix domain-containing protein [Glutamicibacter]PMQ18980.1 transcriptional regulator [Glutamicibacter arilaitensis]CBT77036.1 putative transcriptional regulator [Glutamicibacter arilaitensis Re117]HCJ53221.1 transcriptional regulator [Glutamicibacter sp.]
MDSHGSFDVFVQECPSREIMQRLGDKWTPLVLLTLAGGAHRFSALRQGIGAVTPKVLTNTLRNLERDGLVQRTVYAQVPVRVDYELTDLGRGILEPMEILRLWSEEHVPKVLAARERFDALR